MVAAVILLLALEIPGRGVQVRTVVTPSAETCERMAAVWRRRPAPPPLLAPGPGEAAFRTATCVSVPAGGRDV